MQVRFGRSVVSMAIVGAVATLAAASVAVASNPPVRALVLPPVVVTATPVAAHKKAEPHPEIWAAIHSLEHAREHLDHAAHDFNGHRVEAIGAIDAALRQLHVCLDYDR
jgi:hypothetical protein